MATIDELQDQPTKLRHRLNSIDLLRGLVIVVMALDHTRDFFGASGQNPRDIAVPALFLTRWITNYCAPTFMLLAGVSAYLYGTRGHSRGEVSWFLFTRGLWLILIEFTVVSFGWNLNFAEDLFIAQVIWAIGASMIVLAGLVFLPLWAIAAIGLLMIAGHNLLDGIRAESLGSFSWIWTLLHQPALLEISVRFQAACALPTLTLAGRHGCRLRAGTVIQKHPRIPTSISPLGRLAAHCWLYPAPGYEQLWRSYWVEYRAHGARHATVLHQL